jgi:hypothetical protein
MDVVQVQNVGPYPPKQPADLLGIETVFVNLHAEGAQVSHEKGLIGIRDEKRE